MHERESHLISPIKMSQPKYKKLEIGKEKHPTVEWHCVGKGIAWSQSEEKTGSREENAIKKNGCP
jgi:hypothetical protein